MTDQTKFWYAIYTLSRSEKKLAKELDKKGIENFLPLLPLKKQWSDRTKTVLEPVFPSYVFVKMNLKSEKIRVLQTSGAHHILSLNGSPLPIPEEEIELVKIFVRDFPEHLRVQSEEKLEPGNKVLITRGSFKGYRAIVVRKISSVSVKVNISGIQSSISVDLDPDSIETQEEKNIGRSS